MGCLGHLEKQAAGSIINNASILGTVGFAGAAAYTASKHGVLGLTKVAAIEYATKGIRVNAVNPGVVVTDLHKRAGMTNEAYEQFIQRCLVTQLSIVFAVFFFLFWFVV